MDSLQASSVAVVVPLYKITLTPFEEIALRQCQKVLGGYPILFIHPSNIDPIKIAAAFPSCRCVAFSPRHFKNVHTYSRMLSRQWFYRKFNAYSHILIYQLDCFVFRDDLQLWLSRDYDFVGAPLFAASSDQDIARFSGELNGGLSLRNVQAFINVLRRFYIVNTTREWVSRLKSKRGFFEKAKYFPEFLFKLLYKNISWFYILTYNQNEDLLFSMLGRLPRSQFRIAPPQEALHFAFERHPAFLFQKTENVLPFGCHAWEKYDPEFWKSIIRSLGYQV